MKVAIIGAGVSGLSCALEFKRHGIAPTIFERKSRIGQDMNLIVAFLKLFSRTLEDPLKYLKRKYDISLTPLHTLKELTMISLSREFTVKGNTGYLFKRGEEEYSLENQIAAMVGLPILFDSHISINDIVNDFDYVIAATGDSKIAKELNAWTSTFSCYTRVATVLGDFKTGVVKMWLNMEFCKNAFCFIVPCNTNQAHIALTVNNISYRELDFYWKEFLFTEKIVYPIVETTDHEQNIGFAHPVQLGKTYFTGNSAGTIDNFMGFGALNAIESGILAARSIINNLSYINQLKPILMDVEAINEFRKAVNKFDNNDYDRLIAFLGLPLVKQFLYKNPLIKAKNTAFVARIYNKFKR